MAPNSLGKPSGQGGATPDLQESMLRRREISDTDGKKKA